MVACVQHCRMRLLTHNSHKHTWSHVYNTVGRDHDTKQSQTHMVSCSHLICCQTKSVNANSIINDIYSKYMTFYKILYVLCTLINMIILKILDACAKNGKHQTWKTSHLVDTLWMKEGRATQSDMGGTIE